MKQLGRLVAPLWSESLEDAERRRQRLITTGPVGLLCGLAIGVSAGSASGAAPALGTSGAVAGFLLMYLLGHAESFTRGVIRARHSAALPIIAVVADLVGGALLGRLLASAVGSDQVTSVLGGASLLIVWGVVARRLFWSSVIEDAVGLVLGGSHGERAPDYSHVDSLAARGQVDQAIAELEALYSQKPREPAPLLRAGAVFRQHGRWEEALSYYRRARRVAGLDGSRSWYAVRQIADISRGRLGAPLEALPDVRDALIRFPNAPEAEWGRRTLAELIAPEGDSSPGAG